MLDLKSDNIYYDSSSKKSFLIDGGLSARKGTTIDPLTFQKSSQHIIDRFKEDYWQIPPECWSIEPKAVLATPEMDIYALGILMRDLLKSPDSEIQSLIDRCIDKSTINRPTLVELETSLDSCLSPDISLTTPQAW